MTKTLKNQTYQGERILYGLHDAYLDGIVFGHGESPLKETHNLRLNQPIFQWKYPLWYAENINIDQAIFEDMSRSGIWYTKKITVTNYALQAPKLFRHSSQIKLDHVHFSNALETMWTCQDIEISNSQINGDYFGKDSQNIKLDHVSLIGNYAFDGAKNIEVHNSTFMSKDNFWNCENVTIYDSILNGEYLAWNTKNLTLVNCFIESDQGLNYIDHLTMRNCRLIKTDLAFEYVKHLDAEVVSKIDSVKNPLSGRLSAPAIGQLIMDPAKIDPSKTKIDCPEIEKTFTKSDLNQKPVEGELNEI